jgi:hypothetical protein
VPEPVNEISVLVRGVEFLDQLNKFQLLRKELLVYYQRGKFKEFAALRIKCSTIPLHLSILLVNR